LLDSRLLIVNRYIRQHYAEPLTLDTLAALIGCNPVYLSNMYSKVFHISPMKYLQSVRMSKSLELLTETDLSITEISNAVGYVTVSQFGTIFKRYYRITPYEYRIKHTCLKAQKSNGGG
jgi:AraC-like DNA-binding protein